VSGSTTTYYPFPHYEVSGSTVTKYYFFAGQRIAMKRGNGPLTYLHPDHLGSTVLSTTSSGAFDVGQGYHGYGKYRLGNVLPTDHRFTGQKLDATGLMYYGARYYDRQVGAFISPDTLVPDPTNVWDYNRFAYARLNPLKYNDPTGHEPKKPCCITGGPSLAPKVLQLIVDLAEVVWDGTSSERATAGEVLDVALHHPMFGPSVDEISAAHEHLVETYVDPHLSGGVISTRDTINEVFNTPGVGDVLLAGDYSGSTFRERRISR
jgi:RHS repeat-associated protein